MENLPSISFWERAWLLGMLGAGLVSGLACLVAVYRQSKSRSRLRIAPASKMLWCVNGLMAFYVLCPLLPLPGGIQVRGQTFFFAPWIPLTLLSLGLSGLLLWELSLAEIQQHHLTWLIWDWQAFWKDYRGLPKRLWQFLENKRSMFYRFRYLWMVTGWGLWLGFLAVRIALQLVSFTIFILIKIVGGVLLFLIEMEIAETLFGIVFLALVSLSIVAVFNSEPWPWGPQAWRAADLLLLPLQTLHALLFPLPGAWGVSFALGAVPVVLWGIEALKSGRHPWRAVWAMNGLLASAILLALYSQRPVWACRAGDKVDKHQYREYNALMAMRYAGQIQSESWQAATLSLALKSRNCSVIEECVASSLQTPPRQMASDKLLEVLSQSWNQLNDDRLRINLAGFIANGAVQRRSPAAVARWFDVVGRFGASSNVAPCAVQFATALAQRGDPVLFALASPRLAATARHIDNSYHRGYVLNAVAEAAAKNQNRKLAQAMVDEALQACRQVQLPWQRAYGLAFCAQTALNLQETNTAKQAGLEAVQAAEDSARAGQGGTSELYLECARICQLLGDRENYEKLVRQAGESLKSE